jgi:hypothetical protein
MFHFNISVVSYGELSLLKTHFSLKTQILLSRNLSTKGSDNTDCDSHQLDVSSCFATDEAQPTTRVLL